MNAKEIRKIRLDLGLTQEAFARKLGVSYHTILRWEQGISRPSPLAQYALMRLKADLLNFG